MNDWIKLDFKHDEDDITKALMLIPAQRNVVNATLRLIIENNQEAPISAIIEKFKNTMEITPGMFIYGIIQITRLKDAQRSPFGAFEAGEGEIPESFKAFIPGLGHIIASMVGGFGTRKERPDGGDPMDDIINPEKNDK